MTDLHPPASDCPDIPDFLDRRPKEARMTTAPTPANDNRPNMTAPATHNLPDLEAYKTQAIALEEEVQRHGRNRVAAAWKAGRFWNDLFAEMFTEGAPHWKKYLPTLEAWGLSPRAISNYRLLAAEFENMESDSKFSSLGEAYAAAGEKKKARVAAEKEAQAEADRVAAEQAEADAREAAEEAKRLREAADALENELLDAEAAAERARLEAEEADAAERERLDREAEEAAKAARETARQAEEARRAREEAEAEEARKTRAAEAAAERQRKAEEAAERKRQRDQAPPEPEAAAKVRKFADWLHKNPPRFWIDELDEHHLPIAKGNMFTIAGVAEAFLRDAGALDGESGEPVEDLVVTLQRQLDAAKDDIAERDERIALIETAAGPDSQKAFEQINNLTALNRTLKSQVNELQFKHAHESRTVKALRRKVTDLEKQLAAREGRAA